MIKMYKYTREDGWEEIEFFLKNMTTFRITEETIENIEKEDIPGDVLAVKNKLNQNWSFENENELEILLEKYVEEAVRYTPLIFKNSEEIFKDIRNDKRCEILKSNGFKIFRIVGVSDFSQYEDRRYAAPVEILERITEEAPCDFLVVVGFFRTMTYIAVPSFPDLLALLKEDILPLHLQLQEDWEYEEKRCRRR
jgi:hypothetical protein